VKRALAFAAACLTVIGATFVLLWFAFRSPNERRAVAVGAGLSFVVQLAAFGAALSLARTNIMAGWGLGVAIRIMALAAYAWIAVPQLGLPMTAALVSVALYLFLSTLVEPFFLKP
jgi:hypothetical protein